MLIFYKFCEKREMHWYNNELIFLLDNEDINEFVDLIGYSFYYGCMEFYNSYISKGENDDQKDFDYFVDVVYNILKEYMLVVDYPKYKDFGWRLERR